MMPRDSNGEGLACWARADDEYVVLGLDSGTGEALSLIVYDEGMVGVLMNRGGEWMFLGSGPSGTMWSRDEPFLGLEVARDGEVLHEVNVAEGN